MLNYPFDFEKIKAIFLERKNRFVITANIENKKFNCYLPNPGRLWELLIPHETELMVVKNYNPEKIPFTVLSCKKKDKWVLLHTHITNKIVKDLINRDLIDFYRGFQVIGEEIKANRSRFDLLLSNDRDKMYLEVKTCTLFGKDIAMFPDAVTLRGKKHLLELMELNRNNTSTAVLFVVMNSDVEYFLPAYHIDYEFSKAFIEVKEFVDIKAIALDWDNSFSYIKGIKELKIPFSFIEKSLQDSGAYILIIYMDRPELIRIGMLGEKHFPPGYYTYVGKAKKGLFKRIKRHKNKSKKMKWHIDYFLSKAKVIKDLPIITERDIECALAERLSRISDGIIPQFGSSDCQCFSHLFYFKENPIHNREFIELVNCFRIDMLELI